MHLSETDFRKESLDWVSLSTKEIEDKIIELRKAGTPPSQIGMILRDKWGIPSTKRVLNEKITEILEKHDLSPDLPEELRRLLEKARKIRKHLEEHPSDKKNRRNFQLLQSKIKRLAKYYKKKGTLDEDWSYRRYIYG
ncbi:MAG: 30S ribosomal protein S15 [Candidatus Korarchaeota archaeon]|nr:30S ribosomal protein S15 [Candidatus Korarchaeota archaeon]NIU83822.1 30S ribosomal protein S15 [Candidatus Thorarchaeota archaeon]NIW15236.1 30S ribosomal protein S15 [Candidatus Thorarchaeota archaeon]NIW53213.1 30S ribosomal protein S15 [Candidatus Korarchaeota archaeon]